MCCLFGFFHLFLLLCYYLFLFMSLLCLLSVVLIFLSWLSCLPICEFGVRWVFMWCLIVLFLFISFLLRKCQSCLILTRVLFIWKLPQRCASLSFFPLLLLWLNSCIVAPLAQRFLIVSTNFLLNDRFN